MAGSKIRCLSRAASAVAACLALTMAGCALVKTEYVETRQAYKGVPPRTQAVTLSGANEVPPVSSSATGTGEITLNPDGTVRGSVKVSGLDATAAHLHQGAAGVAGPVIASLQKQGEDTFVFAPDTKLAPEQIAAFRYGSTYINVHSAAHPMGEIRSGQLKGNQTTLGEEQR